ncbi:sensor domain-containing diguanylate cyclase [Tsukamurella sputi]|nr:GGDEF domain-containing protein [Tsukamurella sputi]
MQQWTEVFGDSSDCVKVIDLNGSLRSINNAGRNALGLGPDDQLGIPWLEVLPSSIRDSGIVAIRDAASGTPARFEGQTKSDAGVQIWDNVLTPIMRAGRPAAVLCISRDISSLYSNYSEVRALSETDELTSLLNRRGLLKGARSALHAPRPALSAAGLVLIDVDNLKGINTTYGYAAGNAAIRQVAATIRAVVPPGAVAGRWGGDEFAVITAGRRMSEQLHEIETRLYTALCATGTREFTSPVTATIAAARFPTEGGSVDALVDSAGRKLMSRKAARQI